jgi:hypothetical protein
MLTASILSPQSPRKLPLFRAAANGSPLLKGQLSLPVSMMSQWRVTRSRNPVAVAEARGHSPKARLVVRDALEEVAILALR